MLYNNKIKLHIVNLKLSYKKKNYQIKIMSKSQLKII